MESNEKDVMNENIDIFRNISENGLIGVNTEDGVENELIVRIDDLFNNFPSINSMNDSIVYESMELSESEDNNETEDKSRYSDHRQSESDFCANNCQLIINRLIADNEELKTLKNELILCEEQNVELIKEKTSLGSDMSQLKDSFERKLLLKTQINEDLKRSLYIFESLNSSLQKELEEKRSEKVRLEAHLKEVEDKLYFSEMQLIESQKSEDQLLASFKNARQAFTEEEDNKYKTIEQLHSVYVECAQQQHQIAELGKQVVDLSRELADKDNELWFYKLKFDESFHKCIDKSNRKSIESQRESIYINRTTSELPDYSFSVNEDDLDYICNDFSEDIPISQLDESQEFWSFSEEEEEDEDMIEMNGNDNSIEIIDAKDKPKPFLLNPFYRIVNCLAFFVLKIPFKLILVTILIAILAKVSLSTLFPTRLPAYTSWEEIIYRMLLPYLTKVKVSQTQ